MTERKRDPQQTEVAMPSSIERLYEILQQSVHIDKSGVSIEDTITSQEFEWAAQEIFDQCLDLESDQTMALARAVAHKRHVSPRFIGASVNNVGDYLSSMAALLIMHPSTELDLELREEVLADAHWHFKTIAGVYELMGKREYSASKADRDFVHRVVGAAAIRLEQLEMPHFLQGDVKEAAGNMLIGVAALRGAHYISRAQYRRFSAAILDAQEVSLRAKPADVLLLPPEASSW